MKITKALISVSDKTGLDKILEILKANNIEIISTGGTFKYIHDKGYECIEISKYTNSPEILDGRVKTLHPKIHGGLLGDISKDNHVIQMDQNGIDQINLVIVNLYPFEQKLLEGNVQFEEMIENIDIGGPSMLRSSSKNFKHVTVLPSVKYYDEFIEEIKNNNGSTSLEFRKKMATITFSETAFYDSLISNWMSEQSEIKFLDKKTIPGKIIQKLRYGENPHQESAVYEIVNDKNGFSNLKQYQGKELSHNNYLDSFNAYSLVNDFNTKNKVCAIIKHNNPCGCASSEDDLTAYSNALSGDPVSAFGGVVAFNYELNESVAMEIIKTFYEVILAPKINEKAIEILSSKKNLRVLEYKINEKSKSYSYSLMEKTLLMQDENKSLTQEKDFQIVTKLKPSSSEIHNLIFANQVCKHVKSNAIVIANNQKTLGVGAGQTSRVGSTEIACKNALNFFPKELLGSVAASDAFFPFADGIENLIKAGVKSIIQPGGSIRDEEVIKAADKAGISMVFTNTRNFKH
jgi:phosphoribosylaminoimidazolecarboxamide formyltransferase/IMP cyclohydrolase